MKKNEDMSKEETHQRVREILQGMWAVVEDKPMALTMVALIELAGSLIVTMEDPKKRAHVLGEQLAELIGLIEEQPLRNPLLHLDDGATLRNLDAIKNLRTDGLAN